MVGVWSCISPYEPQGIDPTEGLLVVEASLMAPYGSTVKLSRTLALDKTKYEAVNGTVKIVGDDGTEYPMTQMGEGAYGFTQEWAYKENCTYALAIDLGGKQYLSEFVKPMHTPELKALNWEYNEKNNRVDIRVDVDNADPNVAYYRWDYKENWEIIAPSYGTHRFDPNISKVVENSLVTANNRYYCWAKDSTDHFILGTTEKQTTGDLRNKLVHTIAYGDARVGFLYHIEVKQYAITKEAYTYFRNLQNNVEETGSIFAPQPTEMKGNISCVDNPKETVIGFFVATVEQNKGIYINAEEVPEMQKKSYACMESTKDFKNPLDAYNNGFGIYLLQDGAPTEYMERRCVDCMQRGGSKERPSWWPNNHY